MQHELENELYLKVKSKNIDINCVCEVGVYLPDTSNIIDFIKAGTDAILVEPHPEALKQIKSYFEGYDNIKLYPVAIFDYNGRLKLSKAKSSTFVSTLPKSPALVNDYYERDDSNTFEVDCVIFDEIDNQSIDLLSIDIEGAEWYVLKNLKSRPKVISIETHGKFYSNPFLKEINKWIDENDYQVWYKTMSDTVYYKKNSFEVNFIDKLNLLKTNFIISIRKFKKYLLWPIYFFRSSIKSR